MSIQFDDELVLLTPLRKEPTWRSAETLVLAKEIPSKYAKRQISPIHRGCPQNKGS
ncbi:MAG: hypothetical protein QNJ41_17675 [Xenococcaceae cyanobacterium MO_188.B32]|nr:hypothetical protein [Xenococcaceae cyanobacterium MO_188.B32]